MNQRTVMLLLAFVCAVAGFAVAGNIFGVRQRTVNVGADANLYSAPSVTAEPMSGFNPGEEAAVLERLAMDKPTAVIIQEDLLLEDESGTKYKLVRGAAYQIEDARLQKPNSPCVIRVRTTKGEQALLEVPKTAAKPVDEGVWLRVRSSKTGKEAWALSKTNWY